MEQLVELKCKLLSRIEKSGEAFVSNAVVDGRFTAAVNLRSAEADVDACRRSCGGMRGRFAEQRRTAGAKALVKRPRDGMAEAIP